MFKILATLLFLIPLGALADGSGALMGFANAISDFADRRLQLQAEQEQIRRNEQLEIDRERREYEYQERLLRQKAEYDRENAEQQKAAQDRELELYRHQQRRILETRHPDWKQVIASKDFADWKFMLPLDTKEELDKTGDGAYISEALTAFKEYKSKSKKSQHKSRRK